MNVGGGGGWVGPNTRLGTKSFTLVRNGSRVVTSKIWLVLIAHLSVLGFM